MPKGYPLTDEERANYKRKPKSSSYMSWQGMKARCINPKSRGYHNYGGLGIRVCDEWLHSFPNFLRDMGNRPAKMTLERKDTNGNYEPANCVWATYREQARNQRRNHLITHNGETKTITDWALGIGLNASSLNLRIKSGMDIGLAVTTPRRRGNPKPKSILCVKCGRFIGRMEHKCPKQAS